MLHILHLALGGCLKAPPVAYGVTADTGGHIAYVLDAAIAQARDVRVDRVTIVTRAFADARFGAEHKLPVEHVAAGVTIERIATGNPAYLEKSALLAEIPDITAALCARLARIDRRPDVIHAHFADAAAVARVVERRFGIPFVYTPHALGIDKQTSGSGNDDAALDARIAGERQAIAAAAAIIVSTHDEADRQIAAYGVMTGDRIRVVGPGVPRIGVVGAGGSLADRLGEWLDRPDLPIILAIARPVAKKNLAALLRAYAADDILQRGANLVVLAGQHRHAAGDERAVLDELATIAAAPVLRGRVALPAAHDTGDVAALYDRAARGGVFVNPALHEPFGLTLIEAAAAGVPVVATANGGPAEIVATLGHGLLVDPRDEPALATAIRAIIGDPVRHAACAAAARAGVAAYSWMNYSADAIDIYRTLATPRLVACDLDGTLTGDAAAARDLAAWRAASPLDFVIATGRGLAAALDVIRMWGLPRPDAMITDVGTRLWHPAGDDWRECSDFAALLDTDWDRAAVAAALVPFGVAAQPATTAGPHKLSFFGDANDAAAIAAALAAAGLPARVIHSHDTLIDVVAPAGGKAAAVAAHAARDGVSLAQCVAAGDSGNDADLLAACGHAIVVGNASAELAGLPLRPGLYRAAAAHAAGVLEGLNRLGLAVPGLAAAA